MDEDTEFLTMTQYVAKDKIGQKFHQFLESLTVGQLVSIEFKPNVIDNEDGTQRVYNNVYRLMDRSYADNRKKAS